MDDFRVLISMFPLFINVILSIGEALLDKKKRHFIDVLQLTQEQVDQIKAIEHKYSDQIDRFEQELKQAEMEITRLMINTESPDQIKRKERELETLRIQAAPVYFEKFLAIREALTLPQLQRIQNNYLPPRI